MEKYRCFIAIDLPNDVKKKLAYIQNQLKLWPGRVKWVEEKNFHLTLKFLGDVAVKDIPKIDEVLAGVAHRHAGWEVVLNGVGAFPGSGHPKVIWCGIKDSHQGLIKLWEDVESGLEKLGFARERRRFSPHLTLGRVKEEHMPDGFKAIAQEIKHDSLVFPVNEVKLMKSELSRTGPEYFCINSFYLQEH